VVKAIATLQPIEDIDTTPSGEVFRNIGRIDDEEVRHIARRIEIVPQNSRAENTCALTTAGE
jgi:hypothetical protein